MINQILKSRIDSLNALILEIETDLNTRTDKLFVDFAKTFKDELEEYKVKLDAILSEKVDFEKYQSEFKKLDDVIFSKISKFIDLKHS